MIWLTTICTHHKLWWLGIALYCYPSWGKEFQVNVTINNCGSNFRHGTSSIARSWGPCHGKRSTGKVTVLALSTQPSWSYSSLNIGKTGSVAKKAIHCDASKMHKWSWQMQAHASIVCIFPITSPGQCVSIKQMISLEPGFVEQLKGCLTTSR